MFYDYETSMKSHLQTRRPKKTDDMCLGHYELAFENFRPMRSLTSLDRFLRISDINSSTASIDICVKATSRDMARLQSDALKMGELWILF